MIGIRKFSKRAQKSLDLIAKDMEALSDDPELKISYAKEPRVCDMVFSGGGAKGVAHLGALWALDKLGIRFKRLAGTSAGAITAAMVAAGYSSDEIIDEFFDIDFMRFRDGFWDQRLPKMAKLVAVSSSFGMFKGLKLQNWLEERLVRKDANTFGRLPLNEVGMLSSLDPEDSPRLQIMASDVTHSCEVMMPRDLGSKRYGSLRPGSFPVAAAVRMSIAVPFFFTPYRLHESLIVDGAFASHLPLETFDKEDPEKVRWPTFGINLASNPSPPHPTNDLYQFGLAIFDTMRYGFSRMSFLNYPTRMCRLMDVRTDEVRTLDFGITDEQKERLFINGASCVLRTLKGEDGAGLRSTWNFDRYIKLRKRWSFPAKEELYC